MAISKRDHEAALSVERRQAGMNESALSAVIRGDVRWIRAGNGYRVGYFGLALCHGGIVVVEWHPSGQSASYSVVTLDDWRATMNHMATLGMDGAYLSLARVAEEIALIRSRLYEEVGASR